MNTKVDAFIRRSQKWPEEMAALRPVLLECGLDEEIKWGKPCYSHGGANIAIMQEMNDFLALMFFKGALMQDPAGILRSQGPNSRSALRVEFTSADQVSSLAATLRSYVADAIAVEQAGLKVEPAPAPELAAELSARLAADPELEAAFERLTPGRRREYNLYISDAKQPKTREDRIDKFRQKILDGKGMRE